MFVFSFRLLTLLKFTSIRDATTIDANAGATDDDDDDDNDVTVSASMILLLYCQLLVRSILLTVLTTL